MYSLAIGPSDLDHLGVNLHSGIPAVLSEAVANAWDADAERVTIATQQRPRRITIEDDGEGMSVDDVNSKYLHVGYERRAAGGTTGKGRLPMGRKGIGKLSLFSIADTVTVHTVRDGDRHGFRMDADGIRKAVRGGEGKYCPTPVGPAPDLKKGTRLTLTGIRPQIRRTGALRRRLARRFSIIGSEHKFAVAVDGEAITARDRGYHDRLEHIGAYGRYGRSIAGDASLKPGSLNPRLKIGGRPAVVDGWIGTAVSSGQMKDPETKESINKISVMVRGKMAQEDVLGELGAGGAYSKYVVGEICAEFLDDDEREESATTSRQRIVEDDPRYRALVRKIAADLKEVERSWTGLRNEAGEKRALEIPQIREWFDQLDGDRKKAAKSLFGRINGLAVDDEDDLRQLFIGGILAFESLRFRDLLDRMDGINLNSLAMLKDVFVQLGDIEAAAFYQITRHRLDVINRLEAAVGKNRRERAIQEIIFDHLWLMDPAWERVPGTERMERRIAAEFKKSSSRLTDDEKRSRQDIRYVSASGVNIVVELKRPGRSVTVGELIVQVGKYHTALSKILEAQGRPDEPISIVCVVGRRPSGINRMRQGMLDAASAKIITYDELVEGAYRAYSEYTKKRGEAAALAELVRSIDKGDRAALRPAG